MRSCFKTSSHRSSLGFSTEEAKGKRMLVRSSSDMHHSSSMVRNFREGKPSWQVGRKWVAWAFARPDQRKRKIHSVNCGYAGRQKVSVNTQHEPGNGIMARTLLKRVEMRIGVTRNEVQRLRPRSRPWAPLERKQGQIKLGALKLQKQTKICARNGLFSYLYLVFLDGVSL